MGNWDFLDEKTEISRARVGGPCIAAREAISELEKKKIIECKIVDKAQTEHIVIIDYPNQLWVERNHRGKIAKKMFIRARDVINFLIIE